MRKFTRRAVFGATVAASMLGATFTMADEWPPEQMTVVIPHGVSGTTSALARAIGDIMAENLGTTFVYENKKGASTRIGHDYFMRQPHDGTVLLAGNLSTAAIMYGTQKPDWKWEESIQPLGIYSIDPAVIFVAKDSPAKTLSDLLDTAKDESKTFAISQFQSADTLLMYQIMDKTGAQFELIPHDVSSQALSQVMGGNIDAGILKVGPVSRGGDAVRMLAIALPKNPIPKLTNDVPAIAEVVGSKMMSVASYRAYSVHKDLKENYPERYQAILDALNKALADPRYAEAMKKAGTSPDLLTDLAPDQIEGEVVEPVWETLAAHKDVFGN